MTLMLNEFTGFFQRAAAQELVFLQKRDARAAL